MEGYATTNIHLNVNNWIRTFSKFRVANVSKKVMGYFYEYANIAVIFATVRNWNKQTGKCVMKL